MLEEHGFLELTTVQPEERLIVYGSLAPGGSNAFMLAGLEGEWYRCLIRGHLGHYRGFKSFRYDPRGPEHKAWLFSSANLSRVIQDLDDFEGEEYERRVIPARVGDRQVQAQVYAGKYWDEGWQP
jgi:gamma-glutamylcyclotransferase (GGCT)/AIG2-like uncharacterized protein YtfP